ncbi:MAG TPA: phage major capsid protein [Gemmatimonadaceae bacterium]|jgi:hypothetical protein|nr:phage major capsid protein [Gemmatimonadaceae bacterium]
MINTDGQNVAAAWEAYVDSDPVDNIFSRHKLLEWLRQGKGFEKQNGRVIRSNIEYATNPNVKFMSELEQLTVSRPDTFDYAEYTWKFMGCDVPMTDFESGITAGGAAKFDLQARKLENMKSTMEEVTNTALFGDGTGTTGKAFGGLQLIVPVTPTTGTVGGINRATFSFWRNQTKDGTKTTAVYDNLVASLDNGYNSASNGPGKENPTCVVCDQPTFEGFHARLVLNERIVRDSTGNKGMTGFKSQDLMFKDIPIFYDGACRANTAYLLNDRNLLFVYMQWMKGEPAIRPVDGFYDVFKVLTIGNLTTNNPRRLAVVYNTAS